MNVYINLDPYLAQWFVHEQGGNVPVVLMRGCIERSILEQFLQRLPDGVAPQTCHSGGLPIVIPQLSTSRLRRSSICQRRRRICWFLVFVTASTSICGLRSVVSYR